MGELDDRDVNLDRSIRGVLTPVAGGGHQRRSGEGRLMTTPISRDDSKWSTMVTQVPVRHPDRFYIDGEWCEPSTESTFDVVDSTTGEPVYCVAEAHEADIARAVDAARRAFDDGPWRTFSARQRADILREFASRWASRINDVAAVQPRETGITAAMARNLVERSIAELRLVADLADSFPFEERVSPTSGGEEAWIVHEPVGVVGAIIPWNSPVASITHKLAPALLSGSTFVLKSAPEAPVEGLIAAEIAESIGLPPGVFNVVTADRKASESLVRDDRVDKIAFTGSTGAGRAIGSLCAERVARCTLELGGKSPAVVLDDAEVDVVADALVAGMARISGQVCASLTRAVVDERIYDKVVQALADRARSIVIGDPFSQETQMGPVVSEAHMSRVLRYIDEGTRSGARLVAGGSRPEHLPRRGFYVEPTVFADVDNSSTIAQEEIFGPVLCVIPAKGEEEAVRIANETVYGLNASIFTQDRGRARRVARQLRSGTVGHNAQRADFGIGFGGMKKSGIGREGGRQGLLHYLESKTVVVG
ncbi:aldehyde dehydrogenase [Saccharomonospora sp. NPDC046836]|uniref:aldehyde dehydrogenase n=1 Tax=Saccharomonospora sp. NPDC046836 TaxID=3156921 RepID=UPI0033D6CD8C